MVDSTNSDSADLKYKLMEYHRNAMETRRSIQFKAFLALVTLYLILGKTTGDYLNESDDPDRLRLLLTLFFVLIWLCYGWFLDQMEKQTAKDRDVYKPLERELWAIAKPKQPESELAARGPVPRDDPTKASTRPAEWDSWGWAANAPMVASLLIGLAIILFCWWL